MQRDSFPEISIYDIPDQNEKHDFQEVRQLKTNYGNMIFPWTY